jgi:hypothetical protein
MGIGATSYAGARWGGDLRQHEDQERIQAREDQAGHDPGDQQLADVDPGERTEQHGERRRRDQHGQPAHAQDGPDRHHPAVAAARHLRDHERAEQRRARHARAGQGGERRATGDGDEREARGHAAHQLVDRIEHPGGQARVEEQLAHEQEQGHRDQGEVGQRRGAVVDQLGDAALAAQEHERAQHVRRDERERDRQSQRHQHEHRADHQSERFVPGHRQLESRTAGTPPRRQLAARAPLISSYKTAPLGERWCPRGSIMSCVSRPAAQVVVTELSWRRATDPRDRSAPGNFHCPDRSILE